MEKKQMMGGQDGSDEVPLQLAHMDLKTLMMKKKMMHKSANLKLEKAFADEIKKRRKERKMMKKKMRKERRRRHRKNYNGNEVDCMVTPWSDWTDCSVTCGKGITMKTRMVKVEPKNGGRKCPKKLVKKKKCKAEKCPIDCEMDVWGEWEPCAETCGKKVVQVRRRKIIQKAKHGGVSCSARRERRFCNLPMCPSEDLEKDMRRFMLYHRRY